jgi:hypothetical protein
MLTQNTILSFVKALLLQFVSHTHTNPSLHKNRSFLLPKLFDFSSFHTQKNLLYKTQDDDFVAAPAFDGAKSGFIFKAGLKGTGYYKDIGPATSFAGEDTGLRLKAQAAPKKMAVMFSNRSLALCGRAGPGDSDAALEDCARALKLDGTYVKVVRGKTGNVPCLHHINSPTTHTMWLGHCFYVLTYTHTHTPPMSIPSIVSVGSLPNSRPFVQKGET